MSPNALANYWHFTSLLQIKHLINFKNLTCSNTIQDALKVISSILLCWRYGNRRWTLVTVFHYLSMQQMAAEGQSDKMFSDIDVCMKQRHGTEFLHVGKTAPIDIHQSLLANYGDSGWEQSEVLDCVLQYRQLQQWVISTNADFYKQSVQALVHC